MLKFSQRLAKRSDIIRVYRRGRRKSSEGVGICFLFLPPTPPSAEMINPVTRLAVVVPNKVSNKATERNLIKRRIREVLRSMPWKLNQSVDVVVTAYPAAKHLTFQDISAMLYTLFTQARLL